MLTSPGRQMLAPKVPIISPRVLESSPAGSGAPPAPPKRPLGGGESLGKPSVTFSAPFFPPTEAASGGLLLHRQPSQRQTHSGADSPTGAQALPGREAGVWADLPCGLPPAQRRLPGGVLPASRAPWPRGASSRPSARRRSAAPGFSIRGPLPFEATGTDLL